MRNPIHLLIFLVLVIVSNTYCQKSTIELTFTATYNEQHIPLDSIFIENLTQGGDTTLYLSDTVLVLDYITTIGNTYNGQNTPFVSQNYPNPFSGDTKIDIYLPKKQKINIVVRDILGRKVSQFDNILDNGHHIFTFYPGSETYYLFTVTGNNNSETIKMLNTKSHHASRSQSKLIHTASSSNGINYKSQNDISVLVYALGDTLRYIGFAKTIDDVAGSDVILDAPETNTFYEFDINEGIPCPGLPTITYEGQVYNTVLIGEQCWLKENLNVGTMIDGDVSMGDNGIIEKYCFDNNQDYCDIYGAFYQWNEMMQYSTMPGVQGICPPGWHIPTDEEWKQLEGEVDSQYGYPDPEWDGEFERGFDAGLNLKSQSSWQPGGSGTDLYGFTALGAGWYPPFTGMNYGGMFWTSSDDGTTSAWRRRVDANTNKINRFDWGKSAGYNVRCLKGDTIFNFPTVTTGGALNITENSADMEGEIIDLGGSEVTQHGHCWSIYTNPTTEDLKTELGIALTSGTFTSNLVDLDPETTYFVKAYATCPEGTAYGEEIEFETLPGVVMGEPCPNLPTITYEGQVYNTVLIGEQCWLKENLNVGTMIDGDVSMGDNGIIEKYCFDNNPDYCDIYGAFYQWNEMMQYSTMPGVQGICPPGWHIPTDEEWKQLEGEVDSQYGYPDPEWNGTSERGFDAGLNLKSQSSWQPGGSGTDLYGFTALGAGWYPPFTGMNYGGMFWTSSDDGTTSAWRRRVDANTNKINRFDWGKSAGYNVRCLKGDTIINAPMVTTGVVFSITSNSAVIEGEIIALGSTFVTQHGHCWSTNPNPTILDYKTELGATFATGFFPSNLTELEVETIYYVKAYATNYLGTSYGNEIEFETQQSYDPCPGLPTITYEGQVYNTVLVGDQCWLKENLNVGTMINGIQNQLNDTIIEKYCIDDDLVNCTLYGGLYQWDEMMQYETIEGAQGICPEGWHVPTDEDCKQLEGSVDSQFDYPDPEWDNLGFRGFDAGTNLKSTDDWSYGFNGSDDFGFTIHPTGYRGTNGVFWGFGSGGYFWSSSEYSSFVLSRELTYDELRINRGVGVKNYGFGVRCLKD